MGQTLENGVYLPSEGERNCYAGLKTNWEILDQKVADVTALQQAVSGALHREIVESLPTTDIDPNTIYMILSGTSATENVYNEYMYVNNAWELIGTSATDLTNYYTKAEVDGKLLLKASVSDLTSHTGDTTIHVTTADKTKWNNGVSQSYVLRYSSASVTDNSTIAYSTLDNTDNVKSGDKVIDVDGKIFSVVSVDTANSTVTVGTALIDLALDANVVHTSGNETVGGQKTFTDEITNNISNKANAIITLKNSSYNPKTNGQSNANSSSFSIGFNTLTDDSFAYISAYGLPEYSMLRLTTTYFTDSENSITDSIEYKIYQNGNRSLRPRNHNNCLLGETSKHWKSVYATNYYYGSNNVEFSTKFVTTDTAQTISGAKTFSDNLTIYNSDDTQTPKGLTIRNAQWVMGESGTTTVSNINFLDKNSSIPASVMASKGLYGQSFLRFSVKTKDSQNNTYSEEIYYDIDTSGNVEFRSWHDNAISLGTSAYKWKDVQTYQINGLNPSSLGMPDLSNGIDISSYITTGDTDNNYTPSVNGWIWIRLIGNGASIIQGDFGINSSYVINNLTNEKWVETNLFVTKDVQATIRCRGITGIVGAKFYPCQGNV